MSESPLDVEARERAIVAPGCVLVQAPAGSGKTTLLAQRYLRLLSLVEAPERILALTFTRRAAQEMRERVRQALNAAGAGACPPSMNSRTWELGCAAKRRMDELGFDLERHASRLRIETIDAFNAWLAAQLPVTAGAGSRLNVTEQARPLYAEAARRALAHDASDVFGQAVERVLAQGDQRWQGLVDLVSGMLPSRDRWLPLLAGRLQATALDAAQLHRVRQRFDEDLELLVSRTLGAAHDAVGAERLPALSRLMHSAAIRLRAAALPVDPAEQAMASWQTDGSVLRADTRDIARWRAVATLLLTKAGKYRSRFSKTEGFPPNCADGPTIRDLAAELEQQPAVLRILTEIRALPPIRYDDAEWARVREVAQVMVLAAALLEEVFREHGMVDFPAVSIAAARALGGAESPTDLGLRLDYRLQHILIDEFQDTSSAQLELVKLLTAGWQRGDGRSMFCVGDPMQSIYGFRQAEVRAFLELSDQGIGDMHFELERLRSNFRSARPLVDWINQSFSHILPRNDDRDRGAIAFRPSDSAARPDAETGARVELRGFADRQNEADAIAALVAEQAALHPDWRIAVLVRAKSHAEDIAAGLRARAVAYRAVDIEPLQDRPVVRDLVMLICALLHLGDRVAWLAVLRAPWAGLTLADLLHLARASPVILNALRSEAVLSGLTEDGRSRCERVYRVLAAALSVRSTLGLTRWVEQTWLALGGASCADAQGLEHAGIVFARLRELEERGLPDAADLKDSFNEMHAEYRGSSPIEIMTIHKAKGLEFDIVIVPALERTVPSNRDELMLAHEFSRAGRDGMVMAARPGVGEERAALFDFLRYQTRDAAGLEAQRLLYVACTRAKRQLHVSAVVAGKPRAGSLLAALWPVVGSEFSIETAPAVQAARTAPRGGPLIRVPSEWSPELAEGFAEIAGAAASAGRVDTPVFDWAGETARHVGSLVHAELQAFDLERSDAAAVQRRGDHFRRWLARRGVPANRVQEASDRVIAALVAVHADERARWILGKGYRDDLREHGLSGLWRGEIVRVIFDRSFIDAAGVRWVIDYKTSQHTGGRLEEFLDTEVERYRPQLQRYAEFARRLGPEPVRVGLYFPLMRGWREWDPRVDAS